MATAYDSWLQQLSTPQNSLTGQGANDLPWSGAAASANRFMTQQAINPYIANLPNYTANVFQNSQNTQQMLAGQLPQDVINQIAQGSAERGIAGGNPGSPNANAAYLRALGLSSLDMMGKGSQQLSQSIADTPVPELFNPMSIIAPQAMGRFGADIASDAAKEAASLQNRAANPATYFMRNGSIYYGNPGSGHGSYVAPQYSMRLF